MRGGRGKGTKDGGGTSADSKPVAHTRYRGTELRTGPVGTHSFQPASLVKRKPVSLPNVVIPNEVAAAAQKIPNGFIGPGSEIGIDGMSVEVRVFHHQVGTHGNEVRIELHFREHMFLSVIGIEYHESSVPGQKALCPAHDIRVRGTSFQQSNPGMVEL